MRHVPGFDVYRSLCSRFSVVPVYRRLVADALTPVLAYSRLADNSASFLFESVVGGERIGRYSFVSSGPFRRFEAAGTLVREQLGDNPAVEFHHADPLKLLEQRIAEFQAPHLDGLPRFTGGAVGYAGYDTVRYVEHLPNPAKDDRRLPDLRFDFFDQMVIFDHTTKTVLVVALAHAPHEASEENKQLAYTEACRKVDGLIAKLSDASKDRFRPTDINPAPNQEALLERFHSNFATGEFQAAVKKAQDYILAGDIFQVVLSQRFEARTPAAHFDIYRALRVVNPSPFMFYLHASDVTLVGASPEIMCRVEAGTMTVRPLAGTRRRGETAQRDHALAEELLTDPKERSEHIMLVDLGRNDVGKVCELGSVRLADLMTVERYSHVMHISSTVTGKLRAGHSAFDALRSSLPAGTLSGAPKVRAMQIIDELEPLRRGPYGGAVGYIDFSGNMDTCIALRTMVLQGEQVYIQAGAGIVAESDPQAEEQETLNKALALMRALEVAETQLADPQ